MADVSALIRGDAIAYGLDPNAVLAVAHVEGGTDSSAPGHYDPDTLGHPGWSYGPFQLRSPGALPIASSGANGPGELYAWSRVGIDYALQKMAASGARGKTGRDAIDAIVRNFERPANPSAEVDRAAALYGGGAVSAAGSSHNPAAQNASLVGGITSIPGDVWGAINGAGNAVTGGIGSAAHTIAAPFEAIAGFFTSVYDIITSQSTWIRIAFFAGGLVLIVGGLKIAFGGSGPSVVPIPV